MYHRRNHFKRLGPIKCTDVRFTQLFLEFDADSDEPIGVHCQPFMNVMFMNVMYEIIDIFDEVSVSLRRVHNPPVHGAKKEENEKDVEENYTDLHLP